jgi:anti-sigma factor ChrR (cupin superfamily)
VKPGSTAVDPQELPWRPTPFAGVRWKKLHYDPRSGHSAVLLEFEPGAEYGAHRHPQGEEYLVLRGSLQDGASTWGEGSYVHHPSGSIHAPRSETGCLLFVTLPRPIELI